MHSPDSALALTCHAERIDGTKIRARSPSFGDHFSQATLFWNSMADWEKKHIVEALSFELNMCAFDEIKQRTIDVLLVNISTDLAIRVAAEIGLTVKAAPTSKPHDTSSPGLSLDKPAPASRAERSPSSSPTGPTPPRRRR